jgi:hypothetical protein
MDFPPGILQENFDGLSDFRAFEKKVIPNFIIAENIGALAEANGNAGATA